MTTPEYTQLPDGVISGWGINKTNVKDENGTEYAMVVLTLEFYVSHTTLARQSFVMHKEDAARVAQDFKHPAQLPAAEPETTTTDPEGDQQ